MKSTPPVKEQIQEQPENSKPTQILISQLIGTKYSKNLVSSINLGDALNDYQKTLQNHSVREWALYVEGFAYCMQKQYGILRQDLVQLHSSMMKKDLFYGQQQENEKKSPIQGKGSHKPRGARKQPEQQILYTANNVIQQLEEQSDSSVSNPRNIASNDLLRLQEEIYSPQGIQDIGGEINSLNRVTGFDNMDSEKKKKFHEQVLQDVRAVEHLTFQDILKLRKKRDLVGVPTNGSQSPDNLLVPKILLNNEQIYEPIDQMSQQEDHEQQDYMNFDQDSEQSGQRNLAVMKEFNQLIELSTTQEEESKVQEQKQRKVIQGKVIIDEVMLPAEDEIRYQQNLESLLEARTKMDDLTIRINQLNYHQEFWRDQDDLFQEIDKVQLNLDQLNTDVDRKRKSTDQGGNFIKSSNAQTDKLRQMKLQEDEEQDYIQPFDEQNEIQDYEQLDQEQNKQKDIFEVKLDEVSMKEENRFYNKILFEIKKETDEQEITYDEVFHDIISIKQNQTFKNSVSKGKAFYDLLVMARIGRAIITDLNSDQDQFSQIKITLQ